jgi:single-strand DNA-binding protein
MSNSINSVVLAGRITKEPELRKTQTGKSVCSFTLACDRPKAKDGESSADFISCVAWNQSADYLCTYAHIGDLIGVTGSIQTRSYDDQSGQRRYVTEVLVNRLTILISVSRQQEQSQEKKQQAPAEPSTASSGNSSSHSRDEISRSIASKQMSANDLCWGMNGEAEADGIDPDDLPF